MDGKSSRGKYDDEFHSAKLLKTDGTRQRALARAPTQTHTYTTAAFRDFCALKSGFKAENKF